MKAAKVNKWQELAIAALQVIVMAVPKDKINIPHITVLVVGQRVEELTQVLAKLAIEEAGRQVKELENEAPSA